MDNPQPKVFKFEDNGKLYLRAFLLDATENENGWKVVSASIPQNIRTFIGMPLVLDSKYDHPKWVDGGLTANIHYQQRFAIGTITDVVEKDGKWDAIIEITDPLAREAIANNDIPFFVSPRIVHDPDQPDTAISDWIGVHLAVVDEPAYGDKAHFKGACYGSAGECQIALKSAQKESCGFCVKSALLALLVTKQDTVSSLNSSHVAEASHFKNSMENSPATAVIDTSKFVSIEEVNALRAQMDAFKSVAEAAKVAADAKIVAIEEERRTEKISAIVSAKISDAKKASELTTKFVDAKVSPEFVKETLSLIPEPAGRSNDEQFSASSSSKPADAKLSADSFGKAQAYLNSIVKGASY